MPRLQQIRRVAYNDEEIGMGFNSETGESPGTALEGFTVGHDQQASGQEVSASITIVNSHEQLMESLNLSFEAQGRYGTMSGSAKAKYAETSNYNSTSTFLVASCVVSNPMRRGRDFQVREAAQKLLDAHQSDRFKTAFGDSFVRGLQTGGEFYAVIRITSVSSSTQTDLGAELQAEAQGLVASGSFQAKFSLSNQSSSTKSEYSASMYQAAGSGPTSSPTVEISEVIDRYKKFTEIARDSAVAYETEVASYETLPLDVPTPEETENFLLSLADARAQKLRFIQTRNDLQFAMRHRNFFDTVPDDATLVEYISTYTRLINSVMNHAVKLSRAEIEPALFDAGSLTPPLTEPPAVPLVRRPTAVEPAQPVEKVRIPPLVGTSSQKLDEIIYALGQHSVEDVIADVDAIAQGASPRPRDRGLVEFASKVNLVIEPMPGVDPQAYGPIQAVIPPADTEVMPGDQVTVMFGN